MNNKILELKNMYNEFNLLIILDTKLSNLFKHYCKIADFVNNNRDIYKLFFKDIKKLSNDFIDIYIYVRDNNIVDINLIEDFLKNNENFIKKLNNYIENNN